MLGNWLKTTVLMAGIVALFGIVGATLGAYGRHDDSLVNCSWDEHICILV